MLYELNTRKKNNISEKFNLKKKKTFKTLFGIIAIFTLAVTYA